VSKHVLRGLRGAWDDWPGRCVVGLLVVLSVIAVRNAFTYPAILGYDAAEHIAYAHDLVHHWGVPHNSGAFYTPPLFYLLAGGVTAVGEGLDMAQPEHLGQLLDAFLCIGTAVLVVVLARLLFPARRWLPALALAALMAFPTVLKTAAMFHPQTLVTFLTIAAVLVLSRMIVRNRFGIAWAAALGVLVGLAQLTRSVGIWVFGASLIALAVVFAARMAERPAVGRAFAVVLALGVLIPAPWYLHLQRSYDSAVFGRGGPAIPQQRPSLAFYVNSGLPETVTAPQRRDLARDFFPILYADSWGDYFGIWSWGSPRPDLSRSINRRLSLQSIVGIPLSLVIVAGWFGLAALALLRWRRRAELVAVVLMPAAALAGMLYYATRAPASDADTVKGLFALPALPFLALAAAWLLDTLRARLPRGMTIALLALLGILLAVSLEFVWW
jgi:4-amino-4-deoxy-L-arabinose transferase-like glycosyltransferase